MTQRLQIIGFLIGVAAAIALPFLFLDRDTVSSSEAAAALENSDTRTDADRKNGVDEQGGARLQVPLEETEARRADLVKELAAAVEAHDYDLRHLYEKWIEEVGANGLIDVVTTHNPTCHSEAHDLGKVIFSRIGEIGPSLRTCDRACYSGCLHGVLMEAFTGALETPEPHTHGEDIDPNHRHVDMDQVRNVMQDICADVTGGSGYRHGDCVHGVGHAIMYLTRYRPDEAIRNCGLFEKDAMKYECATGAYMEYVTVKRAEDRKAGKSLLYPCDRSPYPAACFRYASVEMAKEWYRNEGMPEALAKKCLDLDRPYRLGCFHGYGNAHVPIAAHGLLTADKICAHGNDEDQRMCIEGLMERIGRYDPDRVGQVCDVFDKKWQKTLCLEVGNRGMYSREKTYDLYLLGQ